MSKRKGSLNVREVWTDGIDKKRTCVYRYIDVEDNIVKYVGIVHKAVLENRLLHHYYNDDWCKRGNWRIEYFECQTRSEVEAFEAHLIALYGTWRYYNKNKGKWGINRFLPNVESWWKLANSDKFASKEAKQAAMLFRQFIRNGDIESARKLFECFEFKW